MKLFEDLPSQNTPITAENLNQIQDNLVVVSATEPTGDNREKVWIQNTGELQRILILNDSGEYEVFLGETTWTLFSVESNFTNFSWEPLAYKRMNGVVHIHGGGTIDRSSSTKIAQLPEGYRPRQNIQVPCMVNSSSALVNIQIDYEGNIKFMASTTTSTKIEFTINTSFVAR